MRQRQFRRDGNQLIENVLTKNLIDAVAVACDRRRYQHGIRSRVQFKVLLRMRQRVVGDQRRDMRQLRRFGFQEFFSGRSIKEEVANGDRSSCRKPRFIDAKYFAARNLDDGAGVLVCGASLKT